MESSGEEGPSQNLPAEIPEAVPNSHKDSSSAKLWEYLGCCLVAVEAQSIRQLLSLWRFLPEPPPLPPQHSADACGGWGHLLLGSHGKLSFGSVLGCRCSLLGVAPSSLGLLSSPRGILSPCKRASHVSFKLPD